MTRAIDPPIVRLMAQTTIELRVPELGACWIWGGGKRGEDYGSIMVNGRREMVHRVSHTELIGPIPPKYTVDHECRQHPCWNPAHLEAVTKRINILRGEGLAAQNARKTHCKRGHPLTPDNIVPWMSGRRCLTCNRVRVRDWMRANVYHVR